MPASDTSRESPPAPNAPRATDATAGSSADTLLQTMPWGVLVLATDGTVAVLNPAAEALWGVPAAAVLGHAPAQVQPAVLPPELLQALAQPAEVPLAAPYWLPHTRQWVAMRTARATDGRLWVHWENVTASKPAAQSFSDNAPATNGTHEHALTQAALREAEERYRTLFEAMGQGFCVVEVLFDDHQRPVDYRFLVTNPSFEQQTGLYNAVGKTMRQLSPRHEAYWFELYGEIALTGESQRFARMAEQLGRFYEVYAFRVGNPQERKVAILFSDISEARRSEEALHEAEAIYRALFNSIDEGYFLCDVLFDKQDVPIDILYRDANPAATRMVGDDYRGRRLHEIDPAYEGYWVEIFGRVAQTGVPERMVRYAEPDQRWYDFYVLRVGDETSRRVAVVFQDITERQRREAHAAFLASIQDDLSRVATPEEVLQAVGARLGDYLHLSACYFCDLDETQEHNLTVSSAWNRPGTVNSQGHYHLREYWSGKATRANHADEATIVRDTETDVHTTADAFAALQIRAWVGVPFHRQGEWKNFLVLTDSEPRDWQPEEIQLIREVVSRLVPRLERARAEAALRQSEERQAFLVQLNDALRPLTDAAQVQAVAARLLGQHLHANQVHYGETQGDDVVISQGYGNGLPAMTGRFRAVDFGERHTAAHRAGIVRVISDIETDPGNTEVERQVLRQARIGAYITVPLVKEGQWVATLAVHTLAPRPWTVAEVQLVEDVAERTWAAVERARAEEARRESEEKYRAIFNSINEGFSLLDIQYDEHGEANDIIIRDANPAQDRIDGVRALIGKSVREFLPELETKWVQRYAQVVQSGTPAHFEDWSEANQRWYEVDASRVGGAGSTLVAIVYNDITARKQSEQAQREHEAQIAADLAGMRRLYELQSKLAVQTDVRAAFQDVLALACEFTGTDRGCVQFLSDDGRRLEMFVWQGYADDGPFISFFRYEGLEAGCEVARVQRKRLIIEDTVGFEGLEGTEAGAASSAEGIRAAQSTPMTNRANETIGVISTQFRQPHRPSEHELRLMDMLAWTAAEFLERHRADAALRDSEQQFRLMADAVPQIVWLTDADGRVEFFNKQWSTYTGAPYEPTTAAEVAASFVHPDDGAATMAAFTEARATGTIFQVEHRIRSRAGDHRWFLVRAEPYRDAKTGEITRWFGASVDIHDRKQAEVALEKAHERLQLAMNTGRIFSFEMHPETRALELSDNVDIVMGFPLPDHIDSTFQLIHPDDLQPTVDLINGAIDSGGSYASEYRLVNPLNGEVAWFHSQAAFTRTNASGERRFVGIAQNITDRKQAEEAMQQSEARQAYLLTLSDALRSVPDAVGIQEKAVHTAMHYFGADRCYYCEIAGDTVTIRRDAARPGLPSVAAVYHLSTMPIFQAMLRERQPVVVADVATSAVMDDNLKQLCLGFGIVAYINVPVIKKGEQVGMLCLTQGIPRAWTALETALVAETAERTWAAVERAQAEEALRHSEARFRALFESMNQGFAVCELVRDDTGRPIDYVTLDINPAGERLTGVTRADFIGRRVLELMPGLEMWWVDTFAHVVETGETTRFEQYVPPLDRWRDFTVFAYDDDKFAFIYDDITARKQAEQAEAVTKAWLEEQVAARTEDLRASHHRLNTIFEAVPLQLGYYEAVRNAQGQVVDLRAVAVNNASAATMHLPDNAPGRLMSVQLPGLRELPVWQAMTQVIETGQPQRLELRHEFEGQTVWFDVLYTRLEDGIISASLDITARKQVEQELRESEELMQSVFNTSLISMSVLQAVRDESGTIQDFRIAMANKELEKETGRADLVGKLYAKEYPGIKDSGLYALMLGVMESGQPAGVEYFYPHEGFNKWYACQFVKRDDGLVATNLDITERKLAELEQAKSYQLLRQSEEVASLGSWEYNRATGEFLWSAGMYRLFGLPQGRPIGPATYLDFAVADDRPVAERIVQGLTTGRTAFEETLRINVDGAVKTLRVKAAAVFDAAGEPLRMLGVDLDISEVQRLEAENLHMRLHQQQALFRAVLEAQETERGRIAESLHNGLGQILYATKLQLNQLGPVSEPAVLFRADQLLADAIRQTRTLSHELVPTVLSEFGLPAALRDICRNMRGPHLRFECTVELDEQQSLPQPLQVAVYRMAQELAQNVVKHAHATEASLALETVPGFVLLRAEDNGVGFPPESASSNGIGLRTIRDRVALLGGTVDVGASPQYGTYVRIRFPLPPAPASPPA